MDGTIAFAFAVFGLANMAVNDCQTGCLARSYADSRISFQAAGVQFNERWISNEIMVGYDFGHRYGPFQPTASIAATEDGDIWIGAGAKWRISPGQSDLFFQGSLQPGFHLRGDGPAIGGSLHFRAALGVGYEFDNGSAIVVSYDHRSNADMQAVNPGLETLSIQYSMAFN